MPNIIASTDDVKITAELVSHGERHEKRYADSNGTRNIWVKLKEGHTKLTVLAAGPRPDTLEISNKYLLGE